MMMRILSHKRDWPEHGGVLRLWVFITAVPITKLFAGEGGRVERGGHVLRETTSRGQCELGCLKWSNVCGPGTNTTTMPQRWIPQAVSSGVMCAALVQTQQLCPRKVNLSDSTVTPRSSSPGHSSAAVQRGHWGPPIHNMGLCGRPGEDPNAWKQFGPETTGQ
jgi:hypothetical protein